MFVLLLLFSAFTRNNCGFKPRLRNSAIYIDFGFIDVKC